MNDNISVDRNILGQYSGIYANPSLAQNDTDYRNILDDRDVVATEYIDIGYANDNN